MLSSRLVSLERVARYAILLLSVAAPLPSSVLAEQALPKSGAQTFRSDAPPPAPVFNEGSRPEVLVRPAVKSQVVIISDCGQPGRAPVAWGRADHGTVSVENAKAPGCGVPSMNVTKLFYTASPGFKGKDSVYVLGYLTTGNINRTIIVEVK